VDTSIIEPLSFWQVPTLSINGERSYAINVNSDSTCAGYPVFQGNIEVTEQQVTFNESFIMLTQLTSLLINFHVTIIFTVYEANTTSR
jgi:hypothetical protein